MSPLRDHVPARWTPTRQWGALPYAFKARVDEALAEARPTGPAAAGAGR